MQSFDPTSNKLGVLSQRDSLMNKNVAFNTSMNDQSIEHDNFSPGFESKLGTQEMSINDGNTQGQRKSKRAQFAES